MLDERLYVYEQGRRSSLAMISVMNIVGVNFETQLRVHGTWRMTDILSSSLSSLVSLSPSRCDEFPARRLPGSANSGFNDSRIDRRQVRCNGLGSKSGMVRRYLDRVVNSLAKMKKIWLEYQNHFPYFLVWVVHIGLIYSTQHCKLRNKFLRDLSFLSRRFQKMCLYLLRS